MATTRKNGLNGSQASDLITRNYNQGRKTFIVPLTFPDLSKATHLLERISYGADCWELRVDLLTLGTLEDTNVPPLSYVREQLRILQEHSYNLPILYTVRTVSQGGQFPDDKTKEAHQLMLLGFDMGCEYVDVEVEWPSSLIESIVARGGTTKIVASYHDWTRNIRWTSDALINRYQAIARYGDILKLSLMSQDLDDCHELALFVRKHKNMSQKPILTIGMGTAGQSSRITSIISLVTHANLTPSAPGQLTMAQVHQALHMIGQLPKRNFYIFGYNISHSLSPTLHGAGFKELGLPHTYSIHETEAVDESVEELIARPDFGGASVTFPHKLQIGKLLSSTSPQAEKMGAVNTIVVKHTNEGRILVGENSDWSGIKACIERGQCRELEASPALVIGAGGAARAACYALQVLGITKVIIVNRTRANATAMAANFPDLQFQFFDNLDDLCRSSDELHIRVIVACVLADDLGEEQIPEALFSKTESGVVVEMAYRPPITGLMKRAGRYAGWKVFRGTDVLQEQAFAQFSMWTGRPAPALVMRESIHKQLYVRRET